MCSLKKYIYGEINELKTTVKKLEYASWWLLRIMLAAGIVYQKTHGAESFTIMLMCANLLATFAMPILKFICFKKLFFGRLPFRIQSYINIFVFFGSFLGHAVNIYRFYPDFDKFMHVVSGGLVVFMASEMLNIVKDGKKLTPFIRCFACGSFSFVVMVMWELFEFFSDFYLVGSYNQNYIYDPNLNSLFFKIFGSGKNDIRQYPLFDTNQDLLCAVLGCVVCTFALAAISVHLAKKQQEQKTVQTVS